MIIATFGSGGAAGLAAGLIMMIISRKRSRQRIVELETWAAARRQEPLATGHGNHPLPAGGYSG